MGSFHLAEHCSEAQTPLFATSLRSELEQQTSPVLSLWRPVVRKGTHHSGALNGPEVLGETVPMTWDRGQGQPPDVPFSKCASRTLCPDVLG